MQILQAFDQLNSKESNLVFRQLLVLFDQFVEIVATAVFEDDPQMVPRLIPVVKLENTLVFQIMKDSNL